MYCVVRFWDDEDVLKKLSKAMVIVDHENDSDVEVRTASPSAEGRKALEIICEYEKVCQSPLPCYYVV